VGAGGTESRGAAFLESTNPPSPAIDPAAATAFGGLFVAGLAATKKNGANGVSR